MAADSRRQLGALAVLTVVLIGVLWWRLAPDVPPEPVTSARPLRPAATGRRGSTPGIAVEPVRLDALAGARAEPGGEKRDPFRFHVAAPPPAPPPVPVAAAGGPGQPGVTATPQGPPPMLLKFIGILKPTSAAPIAVLTDGKNVFYGREGETLEGRYRIERIGVESVEMAWADGRGRQVIRLSGS